MKLAAIDIGTNSTRLLISDYSNNNFSILERRMKITRLGSGLKENNVISKNSASRTLGALGAYNELISRYKVKKYRAVGTSALRDAVNSRDFISNAEKILGVKVDIVSGDEEARLSFYGVVRDFEMGYRENAPANSAKIMVLDVGGGSSELILGEKRMKPDFIRSIDIGCVNLSESYIDSDIPGAGKLNKMHDYIERKLISAIRKIKNLGAGYFVGVGGTISTLAAIDLSLDIYDSKRIHGHILDLKKIEEIYNYLCGLNLDDRKKVTGIDPGRADVIIGGTAIVMDVLKMMGAGYIHVSERDILDGIIYTLIDF